MSPVNTSGQLFNLLRARDTREIRDALLTLRGGMLIVVIGAAALIGAELATWIPALLAR